MKMDRRTFLGSAALAAGALATGCATAKPAGGTLPEFCRGALLHLGSNMWGDFDTGPDDWARSAEEELKRPNPQGPAGTVSPYHSYLQCRDDLWKRSVDRMAEKKLNLLFIDLGEGVAYPSHPELAVAGTWSVEKFRAELARIRSLGIVPVPKLNFSTCHDAWLKEYHRMVSTRKYYQVVADVIRDVCEIFDTPPLFHLGFDEEIPVAARNHFLAVCRQGDLWWHDLLFCIREVERNGSRATLWSDKICCGREEFFRKMPKSALMSPWYYGTNFTDKYLAWDASFEKKVGSWDVQRNLAASFVELNAKGYEMLGCTSNWSTPDAAEAMAKFARERLDPALLKGLYTAPWKRTIPDEPGEKGRKQISATLAGIDLFAAAMDRHFKM